MLKARPIVMAALAAGILLTGFAFTRIPGGFVPIEDQGYAIGFIQAPDGASNAKTQAISRQVAAVLRSEEDISSAALFSGASLDGNAPNKGFFFFGTKHWDERPGPEHTVGAVVKRLNAKMYGLDRWCSGVRGGAPVDPRLWQWWWFRVPAAG